MKLLPWLGALALGLSLCAPVRAQTATSVQAPAGFAPMSAPCIKQGDGTCVPVSASAGLPADTVIRATSIDRGAIIGFTGAQISTTNGSATITVTSAPTSGTVRVGEIVSATGVSAGTTIASLGTGTGGAGTYTLSAAATATATGVAATSTGPDQLMPANTARRGVQEQNQGSGNCYFGTTVTADYHSLMLAPGGYYESPPTHSGTAAISALCTVAATPIWAREF